MTLPGRLVRDPAAQLNFDSLEKQLAALRAESTVLAALPTTGLLDGRVITYQTAAMASAGVAWRLRYNAASASSYKWEIVGGSPLMHEVAASQTTASLAYVALTSAGPSVTLPLPGDYVIALGSAAANTTAGQETYMNYDIGGAAVVEADRTEWVAAASLDKPSANSREKLKTGLGAVTLTAKYRVNGGAGRFADRWMRATPVRVG